MPNIRITMAQTARRAAALLVDRAEDFDCFVPCHPERIRIATTNTGGFWTTLGTLVGGGSATLFLDRFSGHAEPRFWFGFDVPTRRELRALAALAQEAGFTRPPLVRTGRDLVRKQALLRYRDPLKSQEFDRLVEDRPRSEFYLGVYYPRPWPLTSSALRDVADQSAQFVTRFSYALDARSKRTAVSRWGRPDPEVERAGVKHASAWLKTKRYLVRSREAEHCGYDLLATRGELELHVEVKASARGEHFYLTRNEWMTAQRDPLWRLFLVTDALTDPRMRRYTYEDVANQFTLEATQWHVQRKQ